jgi:hypothetical protein
VGLFTMHDCNATQYQKDTKTCTRERKRLVGGTPQTRSGLIGIIACRYHMDVMVRSVSNLCHDEQLSVDRPIPAETRKSPADRKGFDIRECQTVRESDRVRSVAA